MFPELTLKLPDPIEVPINGLLEEYRTPALQPELYNEVYLFSLHLLILASFFNFLLLVTTTSHFFVLTLLNYNRNRLKSLSIDTGWIIAVSGYHIISSNAERYLCGD